MTRLNIQRIGFSLVETIIALAFCGLFILAAFNLYAALVKSSTKSALLIRAIFQIKNFIAEKKIGENKKIPYSENKEVQEFKIQYTIDNAKLENVSSQAPLFLEKIVIGTEQYGTLIVLHRYLYSLRDSNI